MYNNLTIYIIYVLYVKNSCLDSGYWHHFNVVMVATIIIVVLQKKCQSKMVF